MIRAVGFDLDGTLFDDRQYVRQGLDAAAAELAHREGVDLREAFHAAYFDRDVRDRTFDVVLAEYGIDTDLVPALVEAYHGAEGPLSPDPDAETVLSTLGEEYRLGVLTGGRNGRSKLERLGLAASVDAVLVTPELGCSKRDVEAFERLFEALETAPEEAVYVGDRPDLDVARPNELGAWTVQVRDSNWPNRPSTPAAEPDVTIDSIADLPSAIESIERTESPP